MNKWRNILSWNTEKVLPLEDDGPSYIGWLCKSEDWYGVIVHYGNFKSVRRNWWGIFWAVWRRTPEEAIEEFKRLTPETARPAAERGKLVTYTKIEEVIEYVGSLDPSIRPTAQVLSWQRGIGEDRTAVVVLRASNSTLVNILDEVLSYLRYLIGSVVEDVEIGQRLIDKVEALKSRGRAEFYMAELDLLIGFLEDRFEEESEQRAPAVTTRAAMLAVLIGKFSDAYSQLNQRQGVLLKNSWQTPAPNVPTTAYGQLEATKFPAIRSSLMNQAWDQNSILPSEDDRHSYVGWLVRSQNKGAYGVVVSVEELGNSFNDSSILWACWTHDALSAREAFRTLTKADMRSVAYGGRLTWINVGTFEPIEYIGVKEHE